MERAELDQTLSEQSLSPVIPAARHRRFGVPTRLAALYAQTPLMSWLVGALAAVSLEQFIGTPTAWLLQMPRVPSIFGFDLILSRPALFPSALVYMLLIYVLPVALVAWATTPLANRLAAGLLGHSLWLSALAHLGLLYAVLHIWCSVNDYRGVVVRLTLIAVMLTLSLNVINGYMGEFSCSHPGFMALGAYTASVFSLMLFANDRVFGAALLPPSLGPFLFPVGLILSGAVAALGALVVAIPSFRTRGDYLAVISLAFTFIVKSLFENLEFVGGPRGLGNQPNWATLPVVFVCAALCVWIINNFVSSILGKALNAVRDDEEAAAALTVNTRRTKMTAFLFAAFWAGMAGGLLAHVVRYVNPSSFGLQALAEVLAMLYLGGLNSVYGSIVGAIGFNLLSEAMRPLEIFKWILIPLLVILVMIYRPTGLIAFKEFDVRALVRPKDRALNRPVDRPMRQQGGA